VEKYFHFDTGLYLRCLIDIAIVENKKIKRLI